MTALKEYERLESLGLWRETDSAQLREVVVSFGAASLVLSDKNDMPLAHWSLAAVRELTDGEMPVVYAPDLDADETLEIDDPSMVEAIAKVRAALQSAKPHPGRVRWVLGALMAAAILSFGVFALPKLAATYAARVIPEAQVAQIGAKMLTQTNALTGRPCDGDLGLQALAKMQDWLLEDGYQIHIVDMGAQFATHLPGKRILINRTLIEEYSGPEVAAGFVLMEMAKIQETPPVSVLFKAIGTGATLTFLAKGTLRDEDLAQFAQAHLSAPLTRPEDDRLLALFAKAGLTSGPFAHALDASLATTQALLDGDPAKSDYQPTLADGDWIALQGICSG